MATVRSTTVIYAVFAAHAHLEYADFMDCDLPGNHQVYSFIVCLTNRLNLQLQLSYMIYDT